MSTWQPKMVEGPGGQEVRATKTTALGVLPMWHCPECGQEIWGHRVGSHNCKGVPQPPPARPSFNDFPCEHRGLVYGMLPVVGCECRTQVRCCGKHSFCVAEPVEATVNSVLPMLCSDCPDVRPPQTWAPPADG